MAFLILLVSAALFTAGMPLWLGKVGPNRFYGFRTPRTIADDRVWYPVNKVSGRNLSLAGTVGAVGGGLALAGLPFVGFGILMLAALLSVVHSFYFAATFVAQLDKGGPRLDLSNTLSNTLKEKGKPHNRTNPRQKT